MDILEQLQSLCGQMGIPLPPPVVKPAPIGLSFCSGAMGLDLGLEDAGFKVVAASETDMDARATIRVNRPALPVLGDLRDYTAAQVRAAAGIGQADIDLVAAGPPCQSFSLSGNLRGLADERGDVCLKFIDLAIELYPKYIVLENVRGLMVNDHAFSRILGMFRGGGYVVSYNLYNAAYFGAPQQRERLVIIASLDGRVPHLTPTHSNRPEDGLPPWRTLHDAIGDMAGIKHHGARYSPNRLKLWRLLKGGQDGRHLRSFLQARGETSLAAIGRKACYYKRLAWDEPAPTLVTKPGSFLSGCCHPTEHRPLSVEEYKRIQCFPDDWQICGCLTKQYQELGNAVPVLLGKAVGLAIIQHMHTRSSADPRPRFRYSRYHNTGDLTAQDESSMHASKELKEPCEKMGISVPPPDGVPGNEV